MSTTRGCRWGVYAHCGRCQPISQASRHARLKLLQRCRGHDAQLHRVSHPAGQRLAQRLRALCRHPACGDRVCAGLHQLPLLLVLAERLLQRRLRQLLRRLLMASGLCSWLRLRCRWLCGAWPAAHGCGLLPVCGRRSRLTRCPQRAGGATAVPAQQQQRCRRQCQMLSTLGDSIPALKCAAGVNLWVQHRRAPVRPWLGLSRRAGCHC